MTEAPRTEELYGIAKKMTLELEKLPLHSHAAIVTMMKTGLEHRNIELQNEHAIKQAEANRKAMDEAQAAHDRRNAAAMAKDAGLIVPMNGGSYQPDGSGPWQGNAKSEEKAAGLVLAKA